MERSRSGFGTSETHKSYEMGWKMTGDVEHGCEPFCQIKGARQKQAISLFLSFTEMNYSNGLYVKCLL